MQYRKWTKLDLRKKESVPPDDMLVALRITSKKDPQCAPSYDIGCVKRIRDKIAMFQGTRGLEYLSIRSKTHDIYWCLVSPFDGLEV